MILFKRALFFAVIVLILTAPFQYYNDAVEEVPVYTGLICGIAAVLIGIFYERRHPESLYSATFWDIPIHSLRALFFR